MANTDDSIRMLAIDPSMHRRTRVDAPRALLGLLSLAGLAGTVLIWNHTRVESPAPAR